MVGQLKKPANLVPNTAGAPSDRFWMKEVKEGKERGDKA